MEENKIPSFLKAQCNSFKTLGSSLLGTWNKEALEKYVQKGGQKLQDDVSSLSSEKSTMFHLALNDEVKQKPSFF